MRSGDVLDGIHGVIVDVHVVFLVCVCTRLTGDDKLIVRVVGYVHIPFGGKDNLVRPRIVDGYAALALEIFRLL